MLLPEFSVVDILMHGFKLFGFKAEIDYINGIEITDYYSFKAAHFHHIYPA